MSATAAESSWQFKLLQSPDKMSFIAEFVKALKRDNIESYLSLDGNSVLDLANEDIVLVKRSQNYTLMVDAGLRSFYEITYEKLR